MTKRYFILVAFILSLHSAFSQYTFNWGRALGGLSMDFGFSMVPADNHSFLFSGYTGSTDGDISGNHGANDAWIVRMDSLGALLWSKALGGSASESLPAVQQTGAGGFILGGESSSDDGDVQGNHGNQDFWALLLNSGGMIQWSRLFGGSDADLANAVITTTDGGFLLCGYTESSDGDVVLNHGVVDYWVVKTDTNGNLQWSKTLGGSLGDYGFGLIQAPDGSYFADGYALSFDGDVSGNHGVLDGWLVHLDTSGALVWSHAFGGSADDEFFCLSRTSDGGMIASGGAKSADGDLPGNKGDWDAWMVRFDGTGAMLWTKNYGGSGGDIAYYVTETSDGGFLLAAYSKSADGDVPDNKGGWDDWIIKTDFAGNITWSGTYGGSLDDYARSVLETASGRIFVSGTSGSQDGNVGGNHGLYDYWMFKLSPQPVGVQENTSRKAEPFGIFPNPAKDFVTITLPAGTENTEMIITDNCGRTLLKKEISLTEEAIIPLVGMPSGILFIVMKNASVRGVSKIVRY